MSKACGANKKSGGTCAQPGNGLNGRCKWHGGASRPAGPTHPTYKHGFYSKAIPARLRERIALADGDPKLLSHRRDLGLLDARLEELLERLTEGGTGGAWRALRVAVEELLTAKRLNDFERQSSALNQVVALVRAGADEEKAWSEVTRTIRERREQAQYEHKRTLELSQAIRPDELGVIMTRISQVIREAVADEPTRLRIAREFEKLSNLPEVVN